MNQPKKFRALKARERNAVINFNGVVTLCKVMNNSLYAFDTEKYLGELKDYKPMFWTYRTSLEDAFKVMRERSKRVKGYAKKHIQANMTSGF